MLAQSAQALAGAALAATCTLPRAVAGNADVRERDLGCTHPSLAARGVWSSGSIGF